MDPSSHGRGEMLMVACGTRTEAVSTVEALMPLVKVLPRLAASQTIVRAELSNFKSRGLG